jgi:hypothetical protein
MHMTGFFPSVPSQVNFDLLYAPVNRQWRLFGISVSVGQSGPVAPGPPDTQAQAVSPNSKPSQAPAAPAAAQKAASKAK